MARARNIKPGFFTNEELLELPALTRILFAGLWCIADREGRLEDRPKRIKLVILPGDDYDVDEGLQQLHDHGLILRYERDGNRYICVRNFVKHQNPHKNESPSELPPPLPEESGATRDYSGQIPEEYGASTVQAPEQHSTTRADSLILIPDSLIPDPSRVVVEEDAHAREGEPEDEPPPDLVAYCQANLPAMNGRAFEELADFLANGISPDMARHAVDLARANNSMAWSYARGVMDRWVINNIRTLDAAKAQAAQFRARGHSPPGAQPAPRPIYDD